MYYYRGFYQLLFYLEFTFGIEIPSIPIEMGSNWFSNRFSDLFKISQPTPQSFESYQQARIHYETMGNEKIFQHSSNNFQLAKNSIGKLNGIFNERILLYGEIEKLNFFPMENEILNQPHPIPINSPMEFEYSSVRQLTKSIISNSLVLATAAKKYSSNNVDSSSSSSTTEEKKKYRVEFSFQESKRFPIIQIVEIKSKPMKSVTVAVTAGNEKKE